MSMVVVKGKSISEDELVMLNHISKKPKSHRYHSIECHNFHIRRYGRCVYCISGSTPVPKRLITSEGNIIKVKK